MNNNLISSCCGAEPKSNGDSDSIDMGICPDCGDYCEYIEYDGPGDRYYEREMESGGSKPTAEDFHNWQKLK